METKSVGFFFLRKLEFIIAFPLSICNHIARDYLSLSKSTRSWRKDSSDQSSKRAMGLEVGGLNYYYIVSNARRRGNQVLVSLDIDGWPLDQLIG